MGKHESLNDERESGSALPPLWWETVLAFTSDAIFTLTLDGIVTSWNPGAERLYGYGADQVIGASIDILVPDERRGELTDVLEKVAAGRPVTSFDSMHLRKDAETVDVSISITPVAGADGVIEGAATIVRDISDRKRFEHLLSQEIRARESFEGRLVDLNRQLRQRLQDLETLLEVLPVGIGIAYDQACSEIRLNPGLGAILRLPSGMVPTLNGFPGEQMPFEVLIDDEPMPPEAFPLQQAASTGAPVSDIEMTIVFDDGTRTHLLCFAAPLLDDAEEPRGAVGAFIDITEKRRAETELRQANTIKDEFLGLVSHELRTPLTVVLGLARFLSRDGQRMDADTLDETLVQLRSDAERLSNVIENMLILSRLDFEETDLEPIRVRAIVERAVTRHQSRFPHRAIETDYHDPGLAEGNATWTEQVIANLLSNAEKYSPIDQPVQVRLERNGSAIEVSVSDRGHGVDEEEAAQLFEPFYRSDEAKGAMTPGLGLGLTVCKRLTELQGGTIQAERRDGGGSTFKIRMTPLAAIEEG